MDVSIARYLGMSGALLFAVCDCERLRVWGLTAIDNVGGGGINGAG